MSKAHERLKLILADGGDVLGQEAGVVAAVGRARGQRLVCIAHSGAPRGGALTAASGQLMLDALALADREQLACVSMLESAGAEVHSGSAALDAYARLFRLQARTPSLQLSAICGVSAGGGAYSPALGDLLLMSEAGRLFLTGPEVVRAALGEDVDMQTLGGPQTHDYSGLAHLVRADEDDLAKTILDLLGRLPAYAGGPLPQATARPPVSGRPDEAVPTRHRRVYNMLSVAEKVFDQDSLLELAPGWGSAMGAALARLEGRSVGVLFNQPAQQGGIIDARAAEKAAWFIRRCDRWRLPLAVFVDTPGFLPGLAQERAGVIRYGAEIVRAFAETDIARATIVLRQAYGGAFIVMNSLGLSQQPSYAWSGAQIGVMGAEQAVRLIGRRQLASGADFDELVAEHRQQVLGAKRALASGAISALIDPSQTREKLVAALCS